MRFWRYLLLACTDESIDGRSQILVATVSLGCPKNLVDAQSMLGLLKMRGYGFTADADLADFIIVNTCGFIDTAKKESIDVILDMAEKKTAGRRPALIVTGCLSERYRDQFAAELPEADAVLGTGEYGRIADVVDALAIKDGRLSERFNERPSESSNESSNERLKGRPPYQATIPD